MITRLSGGRIFDPANGVNGDIRDLYVDGGRVVAAPPGGKADQAYDVRGKVVMAGGIDIHSHIAGGKVNLARLLMSDDHRDGLALHGSFTRSGSGVATPSSFVTGYRYAEMGYTAAFEPAMVPSNARSTHLEMADLPIVDKGTYVMLGNDEFLLDLLARGADQERINDYVGWMIRATAALGVKIVNPGGISAFKFNERKLDIDGALPHHRIAPRRVIQALTRALSELGVPHPLHVHCNNLGVPGNIDTTLATIAAAEGFPIHLTHVQFHSYGTEGDRHFSSAAARLAEAVNGNPNVTIDVGQIMFGQTVTASGDTMAQYRNRTFASPDKWIVMDIECDGGCGLVPFRYRDKNFVNALQWTIGLELFLLIKDPWRVFLTTDHPNGAPFTAYPTLIRLLMDRDFRNASLKEIHPAAQKVTTLGSIAREYTLDEIAIMTRAAPARILGLADRGHLGVGAAADIAVYADDADRAKMFTAPDHLFKDGVEVARGGEVVTASLGRTHVVRPEYDRAIERPLKTFFDDHMSLRFDHFPLSEPELAEAHIGLAVHPCRPRGRA
ncbi:MAG: formylmethanofuran dehydrogenase subunit A [Alphaproteobacteria bacterium]|nr:formylmethanofuran dehydrogenase subunit A [Alphaproteobacteria bacterium]